MSENRYALVMPTNSLRITLGLANERHLKTDVKIQARAHSKAISTHSEEKPSIDANYIITSQPTLVFYGRQWIKPKTLINALNQLQIIDVPLEILELILPSQYDGKRHRTTFARLNTHGRMFKRMVTEGKVPYKRLQEIHEKFMQKLRERTSQAIYPHLKISPMIMVDVNPGKSEMYEKDFVLGLRQPFMQKVFTTDVLWRCTDYEVF